MISTLDHDTDLAADVARLVARHGGDDADLISDAIKNLLGLVEDGTRRSELKIVTAAIADLRTSFRVFGRHRGVRKVSVFGSARTAESHPEYQQALGFAARIAHHGYMVITGGGDGIMHAANRGAGRDHSLGCLIQLPFEPGANGAIDDDKLVDHKYFFTRKLSFVKEADALVLLPGGFGTLDECFEVLTLIQTGKTAPVPVVFLDAPGGDYWRSLTRHIDRHLGEPERISRDDPGLYRLTDDADQAVDEILRFYRVYHSLRYIGDRVVVRLTGELNDDAVATLNDEFRDLAVDGQIERVGALEAELAEPDLVHLPRLAWRFDRRRFGRLRALIDRLNSFAPDAS